MKYKSKTCLGLNSMLLQDLKIVLKGKILRMMRNGIYRYA